MSWDSTETHDMSETFNITNMMVEDDSLHSVHHTGQHFEVRNKTFEIPFEELSSTRHSFFWTIVLIFAYAAFLLGIVGNALVICVYTMKRQRKKVGNLFILNLATADMSVVIFCILPTHLANIFVRKLLAIMFPMKMPRGFTTSQARVIIICIWASAATITFPWLIAFRLIPSAWKNEEYCVESWPESMDSRIFFLIGNLFVCYGLPLIIILISNGLIWRHVAQRKVPHDSASPAATKRVHRKTRHGVRKILSIVTLTFFVSWLPLYLIFLRIKLGGPLNETTENIISVILPFAQLMGVSNSSYNPILYTNSNKKFRDSFKSLITCHGFVRSRQTALTVTAYYSNNMSLNRQQLSIQLGSRRLTNFQYPIGHV